MEIKNNRLIINEDEIDESIKRIQQIIQNKLDDLGHANIIANVDFYDNCNEDFTRFWNEINIELLNSDGLLGNIEFATNDIEPTLVCVNGEFDFYYVFTVLSNTCTSCKYMVNTGFCEFNKENDELLENILLDELKYNLAN